MKIAVTGANGQVGSEICLLLRNLPGVEVVPISRNPSGSAFLRSRGFQCRHGRIADAEEAKTLLGDCDVIAHFALSTTGRPRVDRTANRAMARNVVLAARPGARLVFISTIMVYAPSSKLGLIPDSYGLGKFLDERVFKRLCRSRGCEGYVFRLGHVLGELQGITGNIREDIRDGCTSLPNGGEGSSNTIFTAAIARALVEVGRGQVPPRTYDLISSPQWSWKKVYAFYGYEGKGGAAEASAATPRRSGGPAVWLRRGFQRALSLVGSQQAIRERLSFVLALLPEKTNRKVQVRYLEARARREIALLGEKKARIVALGWRGLPVKPVPTLGSAEQSLEAFGSVSLRLAPSVVQAESESSATPGS